MIVERVLQGLGNQLFQYAMGYAIQQKNPLISIKYDIRELSAGNKRNFFYFSDCFVNEIEYLDGEKNIKLSRMHYLKKKIFWRLLSDIEYKENGFHYILEPLVRKITPSYIKKICNYSFKNNEDYYLDGFWEEEEYFLPYRDDLIEYFKFKNNPEIFGDLYYEIKNRNSVFVHIRRTDFLTESFDKRPHTYYLICTEDYYRDAMCVIEEKIENPFYVFFSDDPEYCEKTFSDISNKIIVRNNKNYEDLQLMTLCKNGIIANSTFSFWGAFLNKNKGIFIAPDIHYLILDRKDNWIRYFFRIPEWHYMKTARYFCGDKRLYEGIKGEFKI